jgi:hypothetical protein
MPLKINGRIPRCIVVKKDLQHSRKGNNYEEI